MNRYDGQKVFKALGKMWDNHTTFKLLLNVHGAGMKETKPKTNGVNVTKIANDLVMVEEILSGYWQNMRLTGSWGLKHQIF